MLNNKYQQWIQIRHVKKIATDILRAFWCGTLIGLTVAVALTFAGELMALIPARG